MSREETTEGCGCAECAQDLYEDEIRDNPDSPGVVAAPTLPKPPKPSQIKKPEAVPLKDWKRLKRYHPDRGVEEPDRFSTRHVGKHPPTPDDPHYRVIDKVSNKPLRDREMDCAPFESTSADAEVWRQGVDNLEFFPIDDRFDVAVNEDAKLVHLYDRDSATFLRPTRNRKVKEADGTTVIKPEEWSFKTKAAARNWLAKHADQIKNLDCPTTAKGIKTLQKKLAAERKRTAERAREATPEGKKAKAEAKLAAETKAKQQKAAVAAESAWKAEQVAALVRDHGMKAADARKHVEQQLQLHRLREELPEAAELYEQLLAEGKTHAVALKQARKEVLNRQTLPGINPETEEVLEGIRPTRPEFPAPIRDNPGPRGGEGRRLDRLEADMASLKTVVGNHSKQITVVTKGLGVVTKQVNKIHSGLVAGLRQLGATKGVESLKKLKALPAKTS